MKKFSPSALLLCASFAFSLVACQDVEVKGIPKAPEQFIAFGSSTTTITLTWSLVPEATGYKIERRVNDVGDFELLAQLALDRASTNELRFLFGLLCLVKEPQPQLRTSMLL